jgi:GxxExxY protein
MGLSFVRQQGISVFYKGHDLDLGFRSDVLVENTVLVELKSIERVAPVHHKVTLTYMRFTEMEVGLLVNFNVVKLIDGVTRLVLDKVD